MGTETIGSEQKRQSKKALVEKQGGKCAICGKVFDEKNKPTLDHIIPRAKGGPNARYNLQATCLKCNQKKGARTTKTAKELVTERLTKWCKNAKVDESEFFQFGGDTSVIVWGDVVCYVYAHARCSQFTISALHISKYNGTARIDVDMFPGANLEFELGKVMEWSKK